VRLHFSKEKEVVFFFEKDGLPVIPLIVNVKDPVFDKVHRIIFCFGSPVT